VINCPGREMDKFGSGWFGVIDQEARTKGNKGVKNVQNTTLEKTIKKETKEKRIKQKVKHANKEKTKTRVYLERTKEKTKIEQ
jgi:hypothetical protein